jgi:hypothetical protein
MPQFSEPPSAASLPTQTRLQESAASTSEASMRSISFILAILLSILTTHAANYKWSGMRAPCKMSAEDGLNEKQLSKKIGSFIPLAGNDQWANAVFNVNNRFPGSRPWVTWAVGDLKGAHKLTDDEHEAYLAHMDLLGVDVFLEVWPSGKDVPELIDTYLAKYKQHSSVAGFCIDLEFHKKVDDETAKAWDDKIKSHNKNYRLMLKHWEASFMPKTYRGEASIEALNKEFAEWASHFAPAAVAFQIGYPTEEDGMDGKAVTGWWKMNDPIKEWGDALLAGIKTENQEIGLLWTTVKSGKTYNVKFDLTKGAKLPPLLQVDASIPAPDVPLPAGMKRIFDGKTLDGWEQLPPDTWTVKNGILASLGLARGVIYTKESFGRYRVIFDIRHHAGRPDHRAGVIVFCTPVKEGEKPADTLNGVQFQVPNGGHWDYRKGKNNAGKEFFTRLVNPKFDERQWSRVEILVDPATGIARMAVAQPVGSKAVEVLAFKDATAGQKGPFALQMHNKGLFDEFANIAIEVDPAINDLITVR